MGVRGELFSTKVMLQNRTYFFNVKENRLGDLYLNIVESKNREEGGFERQSVILFAEDLQEFLQGFDESLRALEKAYREKRRGPPNRDDSRRAPANREDSRRAPANREDSRRGPASRDDSRRGPSDRDDTRRSERSPRREERSPRREERSESRPPRRSADGDKAPRRSYKPKADADKRPTSRSDRRSSIDKEKSPYPPKRKVVVRKGRKDSGD